MCGWLSCEMLLASRSKRRLELHVRERGAHQDRHRRLLVMKRLFQGRHAVRDLVRRGGNDRGIPGTRWYIERRRAFGRPVIEHPLARETLLDIEAEHLAALLLTFEAVHLLDLADRGDEEAARTHRALVPIVKAVTGKLAVPCVSEAMELIGGNAYIEESPLPRLLRDAQVLPIWEGTTNILVLDALRVVRKERGHEPLLERIRDHFPAVAAELGGSVDTLDERAARGWVDRLARAFELALLADCGATAALERLRRRPLGLIPGAEPTTSGEKLLLQT